MVTGMEGREEPKVSTSTAAGYDKKVCFVTRRCIRVAVTPADGAQLLGDSVWTLGIGESRLGSPNVTGRLHVELKLRKHADFISKTALRKEKSRRRHAEGGRRRAPLEHMARLEPRA